MNQVSEEIADLDGILQELRGLEMEFRDCSQIEVGQPIRGLQVSRSHMREWADRLAGIIKCLAQWKPLMPTTGPPDLEGVPDDALFAGEWYRDSIGGQRSRQSGMIDKLYLESDLHSGVCYQWIWHLGPIAPPQPELPKCPWCGCECELTEYAEGEAFMVECCDATCWWHSASGRTEQEAIEAVRKAGG